MPKKLREREAEKMIPRIIHRTSKTASITWEERRLGLRAQSIMPDWEIKHWDDDDNKSLVSSLVPELLDSYESIKRGVAKADIARCLYMHRYGGFYIDTDYKVIAPFDEYLVNSCVLPISRGASPRENDFRLGNAVFASIPGHPFWMSFVHHVLSSDVASIEESTIESVTGPEGLTRFYQNNADRFDDISLIPRTVFHPRITYRGLGAEVSRDTKGIHLCWGSWRTKNLSRNIKTLIVRKSTSL